MDLGLLVATLLVLVALVWAFRRAGRWSSNGRGATPSGSWGFGGADGGGGLGGGGGDGGGGGGGDGGGGGGGGC